MPYDNKFWRKTKFSKLANHYQTAKYKFRQYYFHIIIDIIISIYVAFLPLICLAWRSFSSLYKKRSRSRNLLRNVSNYVLRTFPNGYSVRVECITVFHLTWKVLSCSRRTNVLIHVKATYTAFHHMRLHSYVCMLGKHLVQACSFCVTPSLNR